MQTTINDLRNKDITNTSFVTVSFIIYILLMGLDFISVIPNFSLSKVLVLIPLITIVLFKKGKLWLDNPLSQFLVIYIFYLSITLIISISIFDSMVRLITLVTNIGVVLFISSYLFKQDEILKIKTGFIISSWIVVIIMLFFSKINTYDGRWIIVINDNVLDPNYIVGFLLFGMMYHLNSLIDKKSLFNGLLFSILFVFVVLTGSRGGMLAITIASLSLIFHKFLMRDKKISILFKLFILIVVLTITILILKEFLPDSLLKRFSFEFSSNDLGAGRLSIWSEIISSFSSKPIWRFIIGNGLDTTKIVTFNGVVAHNVYLDTLVENGVVGLIMLLSIYFVSLKISYRLDSVTFSSLIGLYFMGVTLSLYSYKPIWNILILLLIQLKFKKSRT